MTSAPHWSGLLASAILVAVATVWLVWTIVATPGYSSSHLNIVNRAEDASSGTPRAQAWRPGSGKEQVWVRAEHAHTPAQDGSGREGGRVYRWEALGREWAVRVWEDAGFLAPSMLMRHESEREATVMPPTLHARCFYTGVLLGANDSAVALSICRGLSGVIRVGGVVYIIEPVEVSDSRGFEDSDSRSFEDSDPRNLWDSDVSGELENSENVDNIISADDYPLFEGGRRLHTFTRTAVPEALVRGRRPQAHRGGPLPPHQPTDNLHVCDSTGSGYIYSEKAAAEAATSTSSHRRRTRRFLYSRRYTIEVMVVVDTKMARYHGKHFNQYVLTLMSVVALIFRDASIGNRIDIAVVEVVRQDRQFVTPRKDHKNSAEVPGKSAEEMLKMFCKWQYMGLKRNPNHPRRYDTALLLTRENICRNPSTKNCDTLGLAELGTMCSRHSSCSIVQDNGLSAAFTIAHELGHLLNMPHDDDKKCSILEGTSDGSQWMNVMSRMLDHNTLPWEWSNCSRHHLTDFLQGGHGWCLEDEPWTNKLIEETTEFTLAGELFNASKQCQYVFGMNSRICPYMPTCKRLWCTTSVGKEGCRTQHMPWADGTTCTSGSWCLRGKCVPKDKTVLKKVNGDWGEWLEWSSCSRTCGVGVRSSTRHCNSPKPSYGGWYCIGERVRYESCIMKPCPPDSIDYRTQQCQVYNNMNFNLSDIPEDVIWVPKYAGISREDSCQLFCQVYNKTRTSYLKLRNKVEDGTPCGPGTYDICVSGKCRTAGCDYVLNSTAKSDVCGVCNGDNSTCQVTAGSVETSLPYGYTDIVTIPVGAAMIEITQQSYHDQSTDDNYLALVDPETGKYLINGGSVVIPFPKLVAFGGTLLEYSGSSSVTERINSTKPLQKKLLVQILSVGDLNPPNVVYSYTKSNLHSDPNYYYWQLKDWSNCTEPCVGKRKRTAYCVRADTGQEVKDELCSSHQKPETQQESCAHTCPVFWAYSDWSKCELKGEQCERERKVVGCVSSLGNTVETERCEADQLVTQRNCPREECATWSYSEWSPCLCKDGDTVGVQRRPYYCQLRQRPLPSWECEQLDKPIHIRNCSCWFAEEWSSVCDLEGHDDTIVGGSLSNCGTGVMQRRVFCGAPSDDIPLSDCSALTKPPETIPCHIPCQSTTTAPPPIPVTTEGLPISSTLTVSVTNSHTDNSSSLKKRKGGKEQNQHNSLGTPFHKHKSNGDIYTAGSSSRQPHHHGNQQKVTWTQGGNIGVNHGQETNEISNALPSSLDERERNSRNDFSDNRLDTTRHHNDYSRERTKNSNRHASHQWDQHRSGEEESNNVVQEYDPLIIDNENHNTNWQTGGWSTCSRDCGGGEKRRQVVCIGPESSCLPNDRPLETAPCNTQICTEWSTGDWGHCHVRRERHRCGRGQQERLVVCRDPNGPQLDEKSCHAADRPTHRRACKIPCNNRRRGRQRQRYKWKSGEWSPCSKVCDRGVMYRNVTCTDTQMNETAVHNEYCLREGLPRHKSSRRCNKHPCPFRWVASPWSECSEVCGPGIETREVSCHAVNHLGWIDPQPVTRGCEEGNKKRNTRKCNLGHCNTGYYWKVKPWKPCQAMCGKRGRQRRGINCVNEENQRVHQHLCSKEQRPRKKQKCQAQPCGYTTCSEVQSGMQVPVDGEYSLLVGGHNMSIFCLGMNTSSPTEYLTLPAGEEGNFAEIYNKILNHPDTCPHGGERHTNCDCTQTESNHSGYTSFSKIRLNTTSLVVDTYDFTFARAIDGRLVRYGEAGDCFSMAMCPQGAFSINLAGTALAVSPRTNWITRGTNAAHYINRLDDNQRILGRCGGYCGTCTPDPITGLKLILRDG